MKRSVSVRVSKWAQIIFIWTVAVVFFAPLCLAVTNSFKPRSEIMASALSLPTSLYLDNYRTVMEDDYFLSSFITSVLMVAATTSLTCLIAAMAGYALARWKCRFSNGLTLVIMSTLFVPFQVYMVALIVIVRQIGLTATSSACCWCISRWVCRFPSFWCAAMPLECPLKLRKPRPSTDVDACGCWGPSCCP